MKRTPKTTKWKGRVKFVKEELPVAPGRIENLNYYVANCLQRIHWAIDKLPPDQRSFRWRSVADAIDSCDANVRHLMLCDLMAKIEKEANSSPTSPTPKTRDR
jgi:hypothetical protein